ncbi:hypothetical protein HOY80DRAFT_1064728 [Tuber brumale]|nr:hypothetical protein HOY80DRAFT_1064728 [Tuber brumale]
MPSNWLRPRGLAYKEGFYQRTMLIGGFKDEPVENFWACARSYGLGSKPPWDSKFLVENLPDPTIYMAYRTIAHFPHTFIDGASIGPASITPEQMTDEV